MCCFVLSCVLLCRVVLYCTVWHIVRANLRAVSKNRKIRAKVVSEGLCGRWKLRVMGSCHGKFHWQRECKLHSILHRKFYHSCNIKSTEFKYHSKCKSLITLAFIRLRKLFLSFLLKSVRGFYFQAQ